MRIWIGKWKKKLLGKYFTQSKQKKTKKNLASSNLKDKAEELLTILAENPFQNPPPYEKLVGDLEGAYSRRINVQHRLVYEIIESEKIVKIKRKWTHYE
jgi:toxin YoeB